MEAPIDAVFEEIHAVQKTSAWLTQLMVLLGAFLVWWLTRHLTKPLKQITEAVRLFEHEGKKIPLPIHHNDEIGLLARSFAEMVKRITKIHQVLEKRNERLRAILNTVVDGVIVIDVRGIVLSFSPSAENIFGYKSADIVGKNVKILMPEPFHSEHDGYLRNYLEKGQKKVIGTMGREVKGRRKDGSLFSLELALSESMNQEERFFTGVVRDITHRKEMERSLKNSEKQFRGIVDHMPGIVYRCKMDQNWTMLFISDVVEKVTGFPATDFISNRVRTYASIIHPHDVDHVERVVMDSVENQRPFEIEYRIIDSQHRVHWVYEKGQGINYRNGHPEWLDGVIFDDTKRKTVETELLLFKSAVEQIRVSVIITDLAGTIQYANPWFCEVTGYCLEEVLGQNPRILKSGKINEKLYKNLWKTIVSGNNWQGELLNRKKDGTTFWEWVVISPIRTGEKGQITNYIGIKDDITHKKRMEEQLKLAQNQAEHANHAKSTFLANMSHEIRTPMNAIISFTELALQKEMPPKIHDYLSKIFQSSQSLLHIINDILDFSKIEAGKLELETLDFLLRDVFNHLSDMFRHQVSQKHLELIMCVAEACHYELNGDALRLGQVLMNLVWNAIKFTDEGEIEVRVKTKQESRDEVTLEFSVRDTGLGMEKEQLTALFQPFSQADTSITRKFGGTGLGLSISKKLVEMMDGEIWVKSEPGVGSVFHFTSIFKRILEDDTEYMVLPDDMLRLRVLVIDDSLAAGHALKKMLTMFGFEVVNTRSGAEALGVMKQGIAEGAPYQLVLVDWFIPGNNGVDIIKQIKMTLPAMQTAKTILLTLFDREDEIKSQGNLVGVDGYLHKPVNCSRLFDTIMDVFGRTVTKDFRVNKNDIDLSEIALRIGGARVLLVEDNAINREVAEALLKAVGVEVMIAENGAIAVQKVVNEAIDIVLMDIQMPIMDGYSATKEIRNSIKRTTLPILAMTAHAMSEVREKCLEAGMNDYLAKPVNKKKLYSLLVKWIQPREGLGLQQLPLHAEEVAFPTALEIPKSLCGIDVNAALERTNGNHKLLRTLLLAFARDFSQASEKIRVALNRQQQSDRQFAKNLIHMIKGMAGNLSAIKLFDASKALETAIKEERQALWPELLHDFETQLTQILASIATLPEEKEAKTTSMEDDPLDLDAIRPLVMEMIALSEAGSLQALTCLAKLQPLLKGSKACHELSKLEASLDRIDFIEAQSALKVIRDTLGV